MIASCNKIFIHVTTGHGLSCQTAELLFLVWALSLWPTEQCYDRSNQVYKLIWWLCGELQLKVRLKYFNYHSCLHPCMHFITLIPTSRCQSTCSTTHKNKCEPAIIFFTGSLLASGLQYRHSVVSVDTHSSQHHRGAFLAADNKHRAEWTLQSRLHTTERGGPYTA